MPQYAMKYSNANFEPITMDKWFDGVATKTASEIDPSVNRENGSKIVAEYNPNEYIINHVTAMPAGRLEPGSKYKITPESSKFVNKNSDFWDSEVMRQHYKDFVNARNFVEHQYSEQTLVGVILDAVYRYISKYDVYYVDLLMATKKDKNPRLTDQIINGEMGVSIGIPFTSFRCSQCGQIHTTEDWNNKKFCSHLRNNLRGYYTDPDDGKRRIIAMVNGDKDIPDSIYGFECSWVQRPAFPLAQRHYMLDNESADIISPALKQAFANHSNNGNIVITSQLYDARLKEAAQASSHSKRSSEDIAYDSLSNRIEEWLSTGDYAKVAAYTKYVKMRDNIKLSDELDDLLKGTDKTEDTAAPDESAPSPAPDQDSTPDESNPDEQEKSEKKEEINVDAFRDKNIIDLMASDIVKTTNPNKPNIGLYE